MTSARPPPLVRGEILNQSVELQSVEVSQTQDFERWIIYVYVPTQGVPRPRGQTGADWPTDNTGFHDSN